MTESGSAPFGRCRRIGIGALIDSTTHPSIGVNIQGPSVIRVPDWIERPLGRYYLYFADHKGSYIRLAFADELAGPWTVHQPGSLHLAESCFPVEDLTIDDESLAAIEARYTAALGPDGLMHDMRTEVTSAHIASPDVHVDHEARRIVMFFHGLERVADQITRHAVSENGIEFAATTHSIERTYLRVFEVAGVWYGLAMPGQLYRLAGRPVDGLPGIETGPVLFEPAMRHAAVRVVGTEIRVYWTRVGDAPECILRSTIDGSGPWLDWTVDVDAAVEVLRPTEPYEGADAPLDPSRRSVAYGLLNQLRDPAILVDGDRTVLFYAFGGESGIAAVELLD